MTNEICSVPDPVAEVNIEVEEGGSTYILEATFIVEETLEIMNEQEVRIRVLDKPQVDHCAVRIGRGSRNSTRGEEGYLNFPRDDER